MDGVGGRVYAVKLGRFDLPLPECVAHGAHGRQAAAFDRAQHGWLVEAAGLGGFRHTKFRRINRGNRGHREIPYVFDDAPEGNYDAAGF
jgi:hypothetical protein